MRLPFGGTSGGGPFHSQSMEAIYAHYPGLVVMTPATVEDAYSMLLEAVAIDDPVIFCEHKFLYYHLKAEKLPTEAMPIGKARIAREGRDLTIVAYSAMVHEALAAAEELAAEGWEIEVVDLRSVKPLDTDTVMASVARTGRLLCVGEAWPWGGVTAEVIARVARKVSACWMRRRNGSTPRTRRFRIIRICGRRTGPRAEHRRRRAQNLLANVHDLIDI